MVLEDGLARQSPTPEQTVAVLNVDRPGRRCHGRGGQLRQQSHDGGGGTV